VSSFWPGLGVENGCRIQKPQKRRLLFDKKRNTVLADAPNCKAPYHSFQKKRTGNPDLFRSNPRSGIPAEDLRG